MVRNRNGLYVKMISAKSRIFVASFRMRCVERMVVELSQNVQLEYLYICIYIFYRIVERRAVMRIIISRKNTKHIDEEEKLK